MGFREEYIEEDDEAGKYRRQTRPANLIGGDKEVRLPGQDRPVAGPSSKRAAREAPKSTNPRQGREKCPGCGELVDYRVGLDGTPKSHGTDGRRHACSRLHASSATMEVGDIGPLPELLPTLRPGNPISGGTSSEKDGKGLEAVVPPARNKAASESHKVTTVGLQGRHVVLVVLVVLLVAWILTSW